MGWAETSTARAAQQPLLANGFKGLNRGNAVSPDYDHANVNLQLLVHGVVQHKVHELVETPQHSRHVPVSVQMNCGMRERAEEKRGVLSGQQLQ